MSRVAIICARGGSKGVPGKNLRRLGGVSLVALTVGQAVRSGLFDRVAVSSDSADILREARAAGADHLVDRPAELSGDHVAAHPAILHCLASCERDHAAAFESIVYLQVTSPFRSLADLANAIERWEATRVGSVMTACPARHSPYFSIVEERADGAVTVAKACGGDVVRRQDAPRCWDLNGAVYVFDRDRYVAEPRLLYEDSRVVEMPAERSLDIDSEFDLLLAQAMWSRHEQQLARAA